MKEVIMLCVLMTPFTLALIRVFVGGTAIVLSTLFKT